MPTVLRKDGFRFQIFMLDHEPPHIHVFKAGRQVIINLGDDEHRVSTRENRGMATTDIIKALQIAAAHQAFLLEKWGEIHG